MCELSAFGTDRKSEGVTHESRSGSSIASNFLIKIWKPEKKKELYEINGKERQRETRPERE